MKAYLRKLTAFGLAFALLAGQAALASEALGWDLHSGTTPLAEGTTLTEGWFWSDTYQDLRTERYLTYTPNTDVVPTVAYGNYVYETNTLTALARQLEAQGKRVVGGSNGDFYVMASGQPLGMVVTDGVLRSSASYHYAIGFRADGTALIGKPDLDIVAWLSGEPVRITGGVNKTRELTADGGGLLLLTPDYGTTTGNYYAGVDVVLRPVSAEEAPTVSEAPKPTSTSDPAASLGEAPLSAESVAPVESSLPVESAVPNESVPPEAGAASASEDQPAPAESDIPFVEIDQPVETEVPQSKAALPFSDALRIGGRVRCVVESVTETSGGASAIPEGCFVLTMNASDSPETLQKLRDLWPGALVDIDITSEDTRWNEVVTALGGMFQLLDGGVVAEAPAGNEALWNAQTARTAIGVKADGTVICYTIDGSLSKNSVGASYTQVAKRLKELGCVDAIGLDGGGSTTLGVTSMDADAFAVVNTPRDGAQRAVSNAIFLTTTLPATGVPGSLQIEPGDALVLSGAKVPLTTYQVDTGYRRMDVAADVTYTLEGDGSVADGVYTAAFTAPNRSVGSSVTTVTAHQGELTGTATVTTVVTPSTITVRDEATGKTVTSLSLEPGATVSLTASALWRNLSLLSQDTCYTWACDSAVGTVTPEGTFSAGGASATGSLTVTAGELTLSIPVTVDGRITRVDDMEGETTLFTSTDTATATLTAELTHVKSGRQSLQVDYAIGEAGYAALGLDLSIPAGERYLGLWVYGDGSQIRLEALYTDAAGAETLGPVATLDFTGWKHLLLPIPDGAAQCKELRLLPPAAEGTDPAVPSDGEADVAPLASEPLTGTLWLDHLTRSGEALEDFTAPTVTLSVGEEVLTATAVDDVDSALEAGRVTAFYDGVALPATWDPVTGTLTASLPQDPEGNAHRVTVVAWDQSGNAGRASADLPGTAEDPFSDMASHWAAPYASYLYGQGITTGTVVDGAIAYEPGKNITRAEFFTMVARWLRLDLTAYENVEVPFADLADVPAWALLAVKAMYAEGIVTGSLDGGALYGRPKDGVTRAEVMTILGRTQEKGWTEADLSGFVDGDTVPDWAADYVKSLVGQDVIHGYDDGTLRPTAPMTRAEAAAVLCNLR